MKNTITILFIACAFMVKGQNIQLAFGPSISKMDWYFQPAWKPVEYFYTGPTEGLSANLSIEYFEKEKFSLSSSLGYFQSGGEIASTEEHEAVWVINELKNKASNIALGTTINFIPLNKKMQFLIGFGPRLDCLIPMKSSVMKVKGKGFKRFHIGTTGTLGVYYKFEKLKVGLNLNYIQRIGNFIHTEPTIPTNWWEPQYLGIRARDQFIVSSQVVVGFQL